MLAGEQLIYEVEIQHLRPEGAAVAGRVVVGEEVTAEAEIFFAHLDQSRAKQLFGDFNFVFSGEMKYLLGRLTGTKEQAQGAGGGP
jgi:3-hydroxyacyl-[acyl-carrier-protein] dehydratase